MTSITIRISDTDIAAFREHIGHKLKVGLRRGGISAAMRTLQHIQAELIPKAMPHPPIDRGVYRAGWRVTGDLVTTPIIIENPVPYAAIIEYGARAENVKPGRKMLAALTEWVKRKGLTNAAFAARVKGASGGAKGEGAAKGAEKAKAAKKAQEAQRAGGREAAKDLLSPVMNTKTARQVAKMLRAIKGILKKMRVSDKVKKAPGKAPVLAAPTSGDAEEIAWAIAMAMKKNGIFGGKGLRIMGKARTKLLKEYLPQEMTREVVRALKGGA